MGAVGAGGCTKCEGPGAVGAGSGRGGLQVGGVESRGRGLQVGGRESRGRGLQVGGGESRGRVSIPLCVYEAAHFSY